MPQLPEDFISLMKEHYGNDDAEALCNALLTTEPEVSVRLNRRKILLNEDLFPLLDLDKADGVDPIDWCNDAFYLSERPPFTFDPLFHAGVYYVQEASSMYVAHLYEEYGSKVPCCALDLCAAPGVRALCWQDFFPRVLCF